MARKAALKLSNKNPLSQLLITATLVIILVAAYEAFTENDFTTLAPTQLFLVAAVLAILGLYLKDEK